MVGFAKANIPPARGEGIPPLKWMHSACVTKTGVPSPLAGEG